MALLGGQSGIDWKADYEEALGEARSEGKLLVVHFWSDARPLARTMAEETFGNREVILASAGFVNVRVEIDRRPELFRGTIGGRGALGTCVLDGTGDVVSALPGFAAAEAYLRFLERTRAGYPALRSAREASAREPGDRAARLACGESYLALDSLRRAEECFLGVLGAGGTGKSAAFAHERLARMRVLRGRVLEARDHLSEYRKLDPDGARGDRASLTEALILAVERSLKEALKVVEEAMARHPASEEIDQMLLTSGVVRHELGEDKRALEVLEGMLRRFPRSPWAPYARERIEHIKNPPPDHQH
jgi:tetratricopeptide (TPR) repeat protein